MTDMSYRTYKVKGSNLIPPHGGYKKLESYKSATIVYDGTTVFCKEYKPHMTYKTYEQMTGAARSGKQNIVEASLISGTSKKTELKLLGVARGSLGELLEDFEDFLRQMALKLWDKKSFKARKIRALAYKSNKSYATYKSYIEKADIETAANTLICLINQTNFLLDRQIKALEEQFLKEGGFTERLYRERKARRGF